jgi:hypothetical protein
MTEDWRIWRPAIWLAILGGLALLEFSAPYLGILILGASVGVGARINQRRRRISRRNP